ncbi:MAG: calcium/proton exchanger [Ktedonobacterales bacterium]
MPQATGAIGVLKLLGRRTQIYLVVALIASALAGLFSGLGANAVLIFVISAVALALLAALVGEATEQVGARLGPGATGVLQSALGNLPELFVAVFALRAGLVAVVQAALVGSILGNSLLVLGLAFLVGGLRHGTQRFTAEAPRMMATLTLLAVAALIMPTLSQQLHTPASGHIEALSLICAVALLVVFAISIPVAISGAAPQSVPGPTKEEREAEAPLWPVWLAAMLLAVAGIGAAFVSDWFVNALTPAIHVLHLSETFTGLVVVAIAGNAVENVVGVQLAAANKPDYAISVILNSSLQVALGLFPVLVLLSLVIGGAHLTLTLPLLLIVALGLAAILGAVVVFDGESTWLEGAALIGLYVIIAMAFWWG